MFRSLWQLVTKKYPEDPTAINEAELIADRDRLRKAARISAFSGMGLALASALLLATTDALHHAALATWALVTALTVGWIVAFHSPFGGCVTKITDLLSVRDQLMAHRERVAAAERFSRECAEAAERFSKACVDIYAALDALTSTGELRRASFAPDDEGKWPADDESAIGMYLLEGGDGAGLELDVTNDDDCREIWIGSFVLVTRAAADQVDDPRNSPEYARAAELIHRVLVELFGDDMPSFIAVS